MFEKKFYAIDTALMLETLYAAPGSVLFDYGEKNVQQFSFDFSQHKVEVFDREKSGKKPPKYQIMYFNVIADNNVPFVQSSVDKQPLVFLKSDVVGVNLEPSKYQESFLKQTPCSIKDYRITGKVVFDYERLAEEESPVYTEVAGTEKMMSNSDLNAIMESAIMLRLNDADEDYFSLKYSTGSGVGYEYTIEQLPEHDLFIMFKVSDLNKIYYNADKEKYAKLACLLQKEFGYIASPKKGVDGVEINFARTRFVYSTLDEKNAIVKDFINDVVSKTTKAIEMFFGGEEAEKKGTEFE